jgi:hypothetical protein
MDTNTDFKIIIFCCFEDVLPVCFGCLSKDPEKFL